MRDKCLGIELLKKNSEPRLYEKADRHNQFVDFDQHAEAAADFLEIFQWPSVKDTERIPRTQQQIDDAEIREENHIFSNEWT